jgi:hypothetical protein
MPKKVAISFETKALIWDLAATEQPYNLASIQRRLEKKLDDLVDKGELLEDAPDARTIKRVIEEDINGLSQETVIFKLKPHIWRLRKDVEQIKKLAEKHSTEKQSKASPMAGERWDKHFGDLVNVAVSLMAFNKNILHEVYPNPSFGKGGLFTNDKYLNGETNVGEPIKGDYQLACMLQENWDSAGETHPTLDLQCFAEHLKAEMPEIQANEVPTIIDKNPYQLIDTLRLIIKRGTLVGKCAVCEGWE